MEKQRTDSVFDSIFESESTFSNVYEVEEGILAALLCPSYKLLNMYFEHLKSEFFENQILRDIARAIFDYFKKYKLYPNLEVIKHEILKLKAPAKVDLQSEYINEIENLRLLLQDSAGLSLEYYRDYLQQFLRNNYIRDKALNVLQEVNKQKKDNDKIDKLLFELTHIPSLEVDIGQSILDVTHIPRPSINAIPTGFKTIDACLRGGGLGKKQLGVIAGISGMGKSSFLVHLGGKALCSGKKVVHYTLELPKEEIIDRYVRMLGNKADVWWEESDSSGRIDPEVSLKLKRYGHYKGNIIIQELTKGSSAVIETHLNQLISCKGIVPELVLVDSADNMRPSETYGNMSLYERYLQIYLDLIVIEKLFDVPLWTVSHFGRSQYNKQDSSVVRTEGSFQKVMKATVFMGLSADKDEPDYIRLSLLKNSLGKVGVIAKIKTDFSTMSLVDEGEYSKKEKKRIESEESDANEDLSA